MANDIIPYAQKVYERNLPDTDFRLGSIRDIRHFPRAMLLIGCYPCQGFSQGGTRDPEKRINYLYREFDRALRAIRPRAFVVENVAGMARTDFAHLLQNQLTRFRLAGYRVKWKILDAAEYGVPQHRARLFIVGIRSNIREEYSFPEPTHGPAGQRPYITQRDVIGNMPVWPEGEFNDEPFHWYYLSRNRRQTWGKPSKTITSRDRHVPLHPSSPPLVQLGVDEWQFAHEGRARRLSYREAARLQGFPADFYFPRSVSLNKRYQVIGNAVPPPLFQAVAGALPDIW